MRLPGLQAADRRAQPLGDLAGDLDLVEFGPERRGLLGEPRRPGKALAVGARRGEQRLGIARQRRAEMEDQRARLADAVRRGLAHQPFGRGTTGPGLDRRLPDMPLPEVG